MAQVTKDQGQDLAPRSTPAPPRERQNHTVRWIVTFIVAALAGGSLWFVLAVVSNTKVTRTPGGSVVAVLPNDAGTQSPATVAPADSAANCPQPDPTSSQKLQLAAMLEDIQISALKGDPTCQTAAIGANSTNGLINTGFDVAGAIEVTSCGPDGMGTGGVRYYATIGGLPYSGVASLAVSPDTGNYSLASMPSIFPGGNPPDNTCNF